ncbi:MAG: ATP-binding protein, partial [Actinobacteria bacterium]|nr:ATP-binding protein [Actinomycetota bacterium]
ISMSGLADAVRNAAAEFGIIPPLSRTIDPDAPAVPGSVARALVLAATQAIANAIQHADGEELRLEVIGRLEAPRVVVRVIDGGSGFEPDAVPADRLGISASIVARVSAVGGRSRIDSDGHGTVVTLEWDGAP